MRLSNDSCTNSNFTLLYHYTSRRSLLKAMGFISLGLVPLISACGNAGAGKNAEHSEREDSTMEAAIEQPKNYSKIPLIDTDVPPLKQTATFAMG